MACAGSEASERAQQAAAVLQARVAELEGEVAKMRAASGVGSLFQLPTKQDVLAGAGHGHTTQWGLPLLCASVAGGRLAPVWP